MPSQAALELLVELNDQASKGLDEIGEKGGDMGQLVKKGALLAGGAVLGLGAALGGAALAAADEEKGIKRLNTTLKNAIPNWDGNTDAVEAYIAKQEELGFADDQLRDSLNLLVNQTGDLAEAQQLQTDAMNLARFGNIDLEKATRLLLKADDESYAALGKLGIQIDKNATKEEALTQIRRASAGQAEEYANTTAGSLERIQNSMGNVVEDIGGVVLGLVEGPLKAFADWFQSPEVQAGIQAFAKFVGETLKGAFDTIKAVIDVVWPILQPFVDALVGFFTRIGEGAPFLDNLSTLFADLGKAVSDAWAVIGPALGQLLSDLWDWITTNAPTILAKLGEWAVAFGTWVWQDAIPFLLEELGKLIVVVWNWIVDNGPTILGKLAEWAIAFGRWVWEDAIPFLLEELGKLIVGVWNWITENGPTILAKLGEWALAFWNWAAQVARELPGHLAPIAQSLWDWITGVDNELQPRMHQLATRFGEMPEDARAQLEAPTGLPAVLLSIEMWLGKATDDILKSIGDWVAEFTSWPERVMAVLPGKLAVLWTRIVGFIKSFGPDIANAAMSLGTSILEGIRDGIIRGWNTLVAFVRAKAIQLLQAMKDALGIESPSKAFADQVGDNIARGIQAGWSRTFPGVENVMVNSLRGTVTALEAWLMNNQAGIQSTGAGMADSIKEGWGHAFAALLTQIDADLMEARRRIAEGVSVGTTTVYNGSNGVPAGIGGGQWGLPGGSGGHNVMGSTGAGGGGLSIGVVNIYAGAGASGRMFADEFVEELEYRLGDRIAIRNGSRMRA